jgi:hypothetical protein
MLGIKHRFLGCTARTFADTPPEISQLIFIYVKMVKLSPKQVVEANIKDPTLSRESAHRWR